MPELSHCPKCGARLSPGLLGGACPNCVLQAAFEFRGPEIPEEMAQIGRYKLLEKIGEGGLGVVYMAEQQEPIRRKVAVKLIKPGMDSREVIARFEAERQALALMEHPNIARIFDAGTTDGGHPYFVMELVRGKPVTEYCDHHNLSTRERLDLFIVVSQAVQHAHQKGIIHRDLKPSNILVTVNDGLAVPKIIDFGIAKATQQPLTEKTLFTRFNQLLGTPAYMSPEQTELTSHDIDTRTDIYSLGVLLYELLTGRPPFDPKELFKAGLEDMLRIIRETEPARPSARLTTLEADELAKVAKLRRTEGPRLINFLRGDLDWIVMKCLDKDRTRRYQTASDAVADLERHLRSQPVAARPPSTAYRLGRFVRRNRLLVGTASLVVTSLLGATIVSVFMARLAQKAEQNANEARLSEEHESYFARIPLAQARINNGVLEQAKPLLDGSARRLRGWEWRWLQHCMDAAPINLGSFENRVTSAAFSPNGDYIALGGSAGKIMLWHRDPRKPLTLSSDNMRRFWLKRVGFTSDGCQVFSHMSVSDGKPGPERQRFDELTFWKVGNTNPIYQFRPPTGEVYSVSITGDRLVTLSVQDSFVLSFWDTGSKTQAARLLTTITNAFRPGWRPSPRIVPEPQVVLSSDLRRMLSQEATWATNSIGHTQTVYRRKIWDTEAGRVLVSWPQSPVEFSLRDHSADIFFFGQGKRILTRSPVDRTYFKNGLAGARGEHILRVYDTDSGRQLAAWSCGSSRERVLFAPDGSRIVTKRIFERPDARVEIFEAWDAQTGVWLSAFEGTDISKSSGSGLAPVSMIDFAADGIHCLIGSGAGQIDIWNTISGHRSSGSTRKIPSMYLPTFSPDGQQMLMRDLNSSQCTVWNLNASEPLLTLSLRDQSKALRPTTAVFSRDGQRVAALCQRGSSVTNNVILVWDLSSGAELLAVETTNIAYRLHFSHDDTRLFLRQNEAFSFYVDHTQMLSTRKTAILAYEIPSGDIANRFEANALSVTRDGRKVVGLELAPESDSSSSRAILRVWDGATGKLLAEHVGAYEVPPNWDGEFVIHSKPRRVFVDPLTLKAAASVPEIVDGPVWFFPRTRRILGGIARSSGSTVTDAPSMALYNADTQQRLTSWNVDVMTGGAHLWHMPYSSSLDQRRVVMAGGPFVLDTQTGKRISQLAGHAGGVRTAIIFPDGQRVLTGSDDGTAKLWDAQNGRELLTFEISEVTRTTSAGVVDVSSDGERLLTLGEEGIIVRSASSGMGERRFLSTHAGPHIEPDPKLYASRYVPDRYNDITMWKMPLRDPRTPPQLIDLSDRYALIVPNSISRTDSGGTQIVPTRYTLPSFSSLPGGRISADGIEFDARGVILLSSRRINLPDKAQTAHRSPGTAIRVDRICRRVHFLHGAVGIDSNGVHTAHYRVHYSSGTTNSIHIRYGYDLRDWVRDNQPLRSPRSSVAWTSKNEAGESLRLFRTSWENPHPHLEIESIDFASSKTDAAPFLVAITVEDVAGFTAPTVKDE